MTFAEISRTNWIQITGITLMPGSWEGRRRLEAAEAALGMLAGEDIRSEVVKVYVRGDRTLQEWGAARRTALEHRLFDRLL